MSSNVTMLYNNSCWKSLLTAGGNLFHSRKLPWIGTFGADNFSANFFFPKTNMETWKLMVGRQALNKKQGPLSGGFCQHFRACNEFFWILDKKIRDLGPDSWSVTMIQCTNKLNKKLCPTVDGWNPAPPAMSCVIASLMLPPATPIISKLGWHPRWCRISANQNCLLFLGLSSCNVNIQRVRGKPFSYKVVQDFGHQQYWSHQISGSCWHGSASGGHPCEQVLFFSSNLFYQKQTCKLCPLKNQAWSFSPEISPNENDPLFFQWAVVFLHHRNATDGPFGHGVDGRKAGLVFWSPVSWAKVREIFGDH